MAFSNVMNIEKIVYINQEFNDDLLKKLLGNVFHLTTKNAFENIQKEGYVYHNQSGKYGLNGSSKKSFGRNNGWVCLFDLRNENKYSIKETLEKYPFLGPSWFAHYTPEFKELNLVYLFIHDDIYDLLIPNEVGKKDHYIPKTECWFPGNLPLHCIKEALIVRIIENPPKDDPFLFAHYMLQVEEYKKGWK